jgi:hypothetical protein
MASMLRPGIHPRAVFASHLTTAKQVTTRWPRYFLDQFENINNGSVRDELHGPYNKLLYTLFPPDSGFTVGLRFEAEGFFKLEDSLLEFEVLFKDTPVFALGLKSPEDIGYASMRRAADLIVRGHMVEIARLL